MDTRLQTLVRATPTPSFTPVPRGILQRKCACGMHTMGGGQCAECAKNKSGLQRKLAIGASNDPLEQEADRVADEVLAATAYSALNGTPPRLQRFTGHPIGENGTAPASVDRVLASRGRPLDPTLQQDMGQRFGHDFSQVRVHTGTAAEQSARDVNALAYTVGRDVVLGGGQYLPNTADGRKLLAHELTHVVQQSSGEYEKKRMLGLQTKLAISNPGDRYEQEADRMADAVMRMPDQGLQRQSKDEEEEGEELLQTKPLAQAHTASAANGKGEVPPVVHEALRSPGKPLDPQFRAFFEPRFGHDFGKVRVHTDALAAESVRSVNALAYSVGRDVVFAAGKYAPGTSEGRRLLAHELIHVLQQRAEENDKPHASLQRAITFEDATAEVRHSVADPKTKAEALSAPLLAQFEAGAFEFLALKLKVKTDDGNPSISGAEVDTAQSAVIEDKFRNNFDPPVPVVQTQRKDSTWEDVKREVTKESALKVWKDIQAQVKKNAEASLGDIVVRTPDPGMEKVRHELTKSPAIGFSSRIIGKDAVTIDRKAWEGLVVRSDTKEAFDGFWILLHEMRHLAGKEDATVGKGLYATEVKGSRELEIAGRKRKRTMTLIGEVESELNILRIGLGLPFRTNYADDGIIFFDALGGGIGGKSGEIGGAFLSGQSKAEREALGALPPLTSDRLEKEQHEKRQKEEKVVRFWAERLGKVKTGTFFTKDLRPVEMSISVAGNAVSGSYKYETSTGLTLSGKLTGMIKAESTDDRSRLGIKVIFEWEGGGDRGLGFWKTTAGNISDQEKSISVETKIPGAWGITTESGGGEWSIVVPGDIKPW